MAPWARRAQAKTEKRRGERAAKLKKIENVVRLIAPFAEAGEKLRAKQK